MTLDELKKRYERFSEMSEKRGDEYHKQAEELIKEKRIELAKYYYDKATSEYDTATMYMHFVNELSHVTK